MYFLTFFDVIFALNSFVDFIAKEDLVTWTDRKSVV